ncbi:Phage portal protein / Phage capsid and scaffold [Streptococcus constellatus]|nr:Phage portal protein / Phage capsid and scaffold [Streptococcus constellatus]
MNYMGMGYLRRKLALYQLGVKKRYRYYAMADKEPSRSIVVPDKVRDAYSSVLGWTAHGVDALADRIVFREFANDDFNATEIFNANNPDIFFDTAIQSALIASCSFVYVMPGVNGELPKMQVVEASRATGILDPTTFLLTEGYAVLEQDEYGVPTLEAYFTPDATWYYPKYGEEYSISNPSGQPLLVPIIHRPDAVRPFGRSRITRAGMYQQKAAKRTLERAEVTAEFYSFPQKYVVGTSQDADPIEKWKATVSSLLEFSKDADGDSPTVGQFSTASMSPFIEQLRMYASLFAGGSGLTLDDLGFPSDNPSSVEAIKAAHENLRAAGRKAQRSFASGFLNTAYVAVCLRDKFPFSRSQFMETSVKWEPLFEADANMLTMIGDGAIKLNQAVPGYLDAKTIRDLTGIKGADGNG